MQSNQFLAFLSFHEPHVIFAEFDMDSLLLFPTPQDSLWSY
jgi:hypothetical protein